VVADRTTDSVGSSASRRFRSSSATFDSPAETAWIQMRLPVAACGSAGLRRLLNQAAPPSSLFEKRDSTA